MFYVSNRMPHLTRHHLSKFSAVSNELWKDYFSQAFTNDGMHTKKLALVSVHSHIRARTDDTVRTFTKLMTFVSYFADGQELQS